MYENRTICRVIRPPPSSSPSIIILFLVRKNESTGGHLLKRSSPFSATIPFYHRYHPSRTTHTHTPHCARRRMCHILSGFYQLKNEWNPSPGFPLIVSSPPTATGDVAREHKKRGGDSSAMMITDCVQRLLKKNMQRW